MYSLLRPFFWFIFPFFDSIGYCSSMDKSLIFLYITTLASLLASSSALCPHESEFFRYSLQSQSHISISPYPPLKVRVTLRFITYLLTYSFICYLNWLILLLTVLLIENILSLLGANLCIGDAWFLFCWIVFKLIKMGDSGFWVYQFLRF